MGDQKGTAEGQSISEEMCMLKYGRGDSHESDGTVEMRKGRGDRAVASVAEQRELLQSETLQMYIPM